MTTARAALATAALSLLAGCTAADAPCLVQRPPLGGYTLKLTLHDAAPAGCESVLPPIFADNWRIDAYSDSAIYAKSDLMPYVQDGGDPDPTHAVLGKGTLSSAPIDGYCRIPELTPMRSDTDPLQIGQPTLAYHATNIRLLSGARYQGSTFQADVDVTIGSCAARYDAQALTPSQSGGTCTDDTQCNPFPSTENPLGSGINPDYAVSCLKDPWVVQYVTGDPTVGICFFTKPFPGLR